MRLKTKKEKTIEWVLKQKKGQRVFAFTPKHVYGESGSYWLQWLYRYREVGTLNQPDYLYDIDNDRDDEWIEGYHDIYRKELDRLR